MFQKKVMFLVLMLTNKIQLGNYLGAIKNWVKLQHDYDCLFFAVDMHAPTDRKDVVNPSLLREQTYQAIATYLACGLDPKQVTLFVQSHVKEHAELTWILTCNANMGELSRMTQFKDKSKKHGESIPFGLFAYPVLMAADILLYQTDLVPVGADQKQHVELTRDLAIRMNGLYGGSQESGQKKEALFKIPEAWIPPVGARIMSLQDPTKKMSKSDPDPNASVFLSDSDSEILKKIKRAVTDSGSEITDADDKPGVKNLLSIQSALLEKPVAEIVATYVGKQYGHLKLETAEIVVEKVRPIREKIDLLLQDKSYLDQVLKQGADQARQRAALTLKKVSERIGFISPIVSL